MLRGGEADITKWNRLVKAEEEIPNLSKANLSETNLRGANLSDADLTNAGCWNTVFLNLDLSTVKGLETIHHFGPSSIGVDTLLKSEGKIPETFLRGCGLSPWEVELSRLYDQTLDAGDVAELLSTKVFEARTKGPIYIGGVFISYSRADSKFVDKLYKHLYDAGASAWLDRHDALAGDVEKQVSRAIRVQDIVLVVLSKESLDSDWVWKEIEWARIKEKEEKRDVLCPVSLDDTWKNHAGDAVLMRHVKKKNVLDFSKWKTSEFNKQFEKLQKGIKINYDKRTR